MDTVKILKAAVKKTNGGYGYKLTITPSNQLPETKANFKSIACLANMVKTCKIQKDIIVLSPKLSQSEKDKFWEAYKRYKPL